MNDTNGCIFFKLINGGNAWEPGCQLKDTYCLFTKDPQRCTCRVHESNKSKIADLLKICVQHLQNV